MRTLLVVALGLSAACGASIPTLFVVEKDLDDFSYRRYQHVLDVEFQVAGNPAEGHTATYFRRGGSGVVIATAFVTVGTTSFDALIRAADGEGFAAALRDLGFARLRLQIGRGEFAPACRGCAS